MTIRSYSPLVSKAPIVVQSLSCVWLFATPWSAAYQASLSFTISQFAQTHVDWVNDAIQPSHPLSPPSPALTNLICKMQDNWSWSSNTLATWHLIHWKRPWCLERLRAGRERDNRGWDGWMASLTQMTWVWTNWEMMKDRKPGVPKSMGSQRVKKDLATE